VRKEITTVTIERERYNELMRKAILVETYEKAIKDLTKEVQELRAINTIDATKKYYKRNFVLDLDDYKEARKAGMTNKEYAERHNISPQLLRRRVKEEIIKKPPLTKETYFELRNDGARNIDIAAIYEITPKTLYTILNELGIPKNER